MSTKFRNSGSSQTQMMDELKVSARVDSYLPLNQLNSTSPSHLQISTIRKDTQEEPESGAESRKREQMKAES